MAPVVNRLPTPVLETLSDGSPDYADAFEVRTDIADDRSTRGVEDATPIGADQPAALSAGDGRFFARRRDELVTGVVHCPSLALPRRPGYGGT